MKFHHSLHLRQSLQHVLADLLDSGQGERAFVADHQCLLSMIPFQVWAGAVLQQYLVVLSRQHDL